MAAPVALVPAAVATCVVAAGWLYMTDPGQWIPGPRIGEALPLDELSHHAGAPVLLFVAVWAAAGAVLGLVGRLVGIDRLTAGLLLALLVGMVVYVDTAISIATVRQIPAQHAFDHAAGLPAVYLAAALAGLGGALLGHVRVSGRRAATVLATAVAAAGALDILRALLPGSHAIVGGLAPDAVRSVAAAFGVPVGVALLLSARGIARGKRIAWLTAIMLLTVSVSLHVLHGFNDGGILAAVVLVSLVAMRGDFRAGSDPAAPRRAFVRLAVTLAAVPLFGVAAIWINRTAADRPFSFGFALHETLVSSLGVGTGHLEAPFGGWFPLTVLILVATGIAWTLSAAVAPWRYELAQAALGMGPRAIARRHVGGRHALAVRIARGQVVLLRGERGRVPRLPCRRRRGDRVRRPDRRAGCPGAAVRALPRICTRPRLEGGRARGVRGCAPALPSPSAASDLSRRRGSARRRRVLARGPLDPQGAPVRAAARARGLHRADRAAGGRVAGGETGAGADRRRRGGAESHRRGS